jgi:hypothetical protein
VIGLDHLLRIGSLDFPWSFDQLICHVDIILFLINMIIIIVFPFATFKYGLSRLAKKLTELDVIGGHS